MHAIQGNNTHPTETPIKKTGRETQAVLISVITLDILHLEELFDDEDLGRSVGCMLAEDHVPPSMSAASVPLSLSEIAGGEETARYEGSEVINMRNVHGPGSHH
ncbi:hypothetical protein B0H17DRAFT_1137869 [Mycena rosella]|uniref:Uncharacterized protein n=1 Tax=Mycena rosella TaxID=1033263 RepID=A0AAD7D800_MYCRO|nr:hypothetical protein B0H17DRAFT_1137869 [Mycena rosella]